MTERPGELGHGKDAGVEAPDLGLEKLPDGAVGAAGVDVAPPDPDSLPLRAKGQQSRRLGVVDEDEIGRLEFVAERLRVFDLHRLVGVHVLFAEILPESLERVVDFFRGREIGGVPLDHLPGRLEAHVVHQRDEPVENFRHPAPVAGRVHMDDAPAPDRLSRPRFRCRPFRFSTIDWTRPSGLLADPPG